MGKWQEKSGEMNFTMLLGDSSEYEIKHDLIPSGQNFLIKCDILIADKVES